MDKVLDKVIGPGPEFPSQDERTVQGIKVTKNRVINENQRLRIQMSEMARVIEKTTSENQRLRSHIQVLIGGEQKPKIVHF